MKELLLILPALGLFSCSKTDIPEPKKTETNATSDRSISPSKTETNTVTFIIPKGTRESRPNPVIQTTSDQLGFGVLFDSSIIYKTSAVSGQKLNTLYGFSDGNSSPETNSARLSWYWKDGLLRLFAVVKYDGKTLEQEIGQVSIGRIIGCRITCKERSFLFEAGNTSVELPRAGTGSFTRQILNPYFADSLPAPHNIRIQILQKKR